MNPILRNTLALFAGLMIGGFINGGIISISGNMIPLPPGVDPSDPESIKANIHLYEFKHFIFPFLAHALGALVGGFVAAKLAFSSKLQLALAVGGFFLIGGIVMVITVGGPLAFILTDLILAYIPMAWLGAKLAGTKN